MIIFSGDIKANSGAKLPTVCKDLRVKESDFGKSCTGEDYAFQQT